MENLEIFKDEIANAIQSERYTILQVVAYLTERHGHMKGFSERTLRKYCNENGIRASSKAYVADDVLVEAVEEAIEQVRHVMYKKFGYQNDNVRLFYVLN